MESQIKPYPTEPAVTPDISTVNHWRERYHKAVAPLGKAAAIQKRLEEADPATFGGQKGYFKVQNLQADSAGLSITMKAVLLLEKQTVPQPV